MKSNTVIHGGSPSRASSAQTVDAAPAVGGLQVLRVHPGDGPILDQGQLRRVVTLAKLAHRTPGLQIWTGPAGVGKTVTAEQLAFECNAAAEQRLPESYRAHYFITGGDIECKGQRQMKRGVYCAYEQLVEELTTAELRQRTETSLATDVVEEARLNNTQLIIIDEAGTKTEAEIRGLALICDIARQLYWPLSVILVGMDDLAEKSTGLHVLRSRTRFMAAFEPWDEQECRAYVISRSPAVASMVTDDAAGAGHLVNALVEMSGGHLREIQTLLPEIEQRLTRGRAPKKVIAHVLEWRRGAEERALEQASAYRERQRQRRRRST